MNSKNKIDKIIVYFSYKYLLSINFNDFKIFKKIINLYNKLNLEQL